MRHIKYIAFFLSAGLTLSCARELQLTQPLSTIGQAIPDQFTAYLSSSDSKVYLEGDKIGLSWDEGDMISVFGSTANEKYIFDGKTGENFGTFTRVPLESAATTTFQHYYGVCPYDKNTVCTGEGQFNMKIPTEQSYCEGSFAREANIMVAVTESGINDDTNLKFRNACGYLCIKLYSTSDAVIKSVTLVGNNGEKLSGDCTVTSIAGSMPVISMSEVIPPVMEGVAGYAEDYMEAEGEYSPENNGGEGFAEEQGSYGTKAQSKSAPYNMKSTSEETAQGAQCKVVIDCGEEGVELRKTPDNATEFIFAIPPTEFSKGFTINVVDELGDIHSKKTTGSVSIRRSELVPYAAVRIDEEGGGREFTEFSLITSDGREYIARNITENTVEVFVPKNVDRTTLKARFTTNGTTVSVNGNEQESGKTVNNFTVPVTYKVANSHGRERTYTITVHERPFIIACWGDSFTHYGSSDSQPKPTHYPVILQDLLGPEWEVFDGGIGGDYSNEIAARMGAIKTRIKHNGGFWFPTSTEKTSITSIYTDDKSLDPDDNDKHFRPSRWNNTEKSRPARGVNPATVAGVECTLYYQSVTRTTAGERVFVEDGAAITTYAGKHLRDADVIVLYLGTNGGWQADRLNYPLLIAQHNAMIDFTTNKRYIILTSHVSHGFTFHGGDRQDYLKLMHNTYTDAVTKQDHVVELRKQVNERAPYFLVSTGKYESEADISATDWDYINNKHDWPLSFFYSASDEHPNRYGSTAMAMLIVEKMQELGYLDEQ